MEGISKLHKELIEAKKTLETSKRGEVENDLTEIGLFLTGLDHKVKSLMEEELQVKEESAQLKSKKLQVSQKLKAQDEECKSLREEFDYSREESASLAKQAATYEAKIKLCKSYRLAEADEKTLQRAVDKMNSYRKLSGIKFVGPPDGKVVEGCVYNEKSNYLRQFKTNNSGKNPEIWKLIEEASHSDWHNLRNLIKKELQSKQGDKIC